MKRIFLVGYMGVGKTTISHVLANLFNFSAIDLDYWIQRTYRKTISELFKEKGEEKFRQIERNALLEVAAFENVVISTGGGTPCFFDNMEMMNQAGITVYMKASVAELAARLNASKTVRPLLAGKDDVAMVAFIEKHLTLREPFYKKAHITFHSNRLVTKEHTVQTAQAIAEMIVEYNRVEKKSYLGNVPNES